MSDLINREEAIDALWKALYEYEDNTEKQFQKSEDLDVGDWIGHRIFVQNMSDIDKQTILNLPSADAVPVVRCKDCVHWEKNNWNPNGMCNAFDDGSVCILTETDADEYCARAERKEE